MVPLLRRPHRAAPSPLVGPGDSPQHIWRAAVAVALGGVVITALLAWWMWTRAEADATEALAEQGQQLADRVDGALDEVVERLISVGGLFRASDTVTQDEFRSFITDFRPIPGMGGIGYMPLVPADELASFEAEMAQTIPGYQVFEFDAEGERVPVKDRSFYVPLQWFEPDDAFGSPHGFDSYSEQDRRFAITRARIDKEAATTPFISLLSETEADGFLIYWPVSNPDGTGVMGFTLAPMDLSELLDGNIAPDEAAQLDWTIEVVTSAGRRPTAALADSWNTVMDVGSNWWSLTVTRIGDMALGPGRTEVVMVLVLVAGLVTSVLGAVGAYQYRRKTETQKELSKLIELTRAKDQFLASVSHELRTPLTGVLGFAELLRDNQGDLDEEERKTMIVNVAEEATDLAAIIEDLLVAARSELDLLAVTQVPVSLRAQVAQVLEATDKGTAGKVEVISEPGSRYSGVGDPGRVRQIIRNLITNAQRYGGERIQVRLEQDDDLVSLEVADNGEGIPDEEWERVFEPYYRAHQSPTQPAAIGIGLSVARHLARLMGGDLSYHREGGWSVFRFTLAATVTVEITPVETQQPAVATSRSR